MNKLCDRKKQINYLGIIILIIFSFFIPVTLPRKADSGDQPRSSSLREVTTEEGQRTDHYDVDEKLAFAADKHYATVIKISGDHYLLEECFDEHSNPAEQALGYFVYFVSMMNLVVSIRCII